jgi:hypothetical protein
MVIPWIEANTRSSIENGVIFAFAGNDLQGCTVPVLNL